MIWLIILAALCVGFLMGYVTCAVFRRNDKAYPLVNISGDLSLRAKEYESD